MQSSHSDTANHWVVTQRIHFHRPLFALVASFHLNSTRYTTSLHDIRFSSATFPWFFSTNSFRHDTCANNVTEQLWNFGGFFDFLQGPSPAMMVGCWCDVSLKCRLHFLHPPNYTPQPVQNSLADFTTRTVFAFAFSFFLSAAPLKKKTYTVWKHTIVHTCMSRNERELSFTLWNARTYQHYYSMKILRQFARGGCR